MKLILTNDKLTLEGADSAALDAAEKATTIKTTKFLFRRNEKPKYDGIQREELFDRDSCTAPAGLYPLLLGTLRKAGNTVELVDTRMKPCEPDMAADLAWLRDYQREAVLTAVQRGRCILKLATGAGKGDMTVGILRLLPTARWLILAHRSNLIRDIKARIQARADKDGAEHMDIGVFGDGDKDTGNRIIVATYDSLRASKNLAAVKAMMKSRDGIIVDECHALAAATRIRLLRMCSNAYWRVGESGTPLDRGDGKSLKVIGALGPIVAEVTAAELIDKGYLAKPTVKVVEYDHEEFASDLWLKVKKIGIQHDNNRNAAVLWAAQQARKPCMLFVDNIEHGQLITKWLQREGLNAEIVFGLSSTTQRAAALKKLARGDLDIIVASPVFDEGVDITCLESVVLAPGGKALISLLQRIGRAMRRTEDKDTFEIWDFADEGHRILKDHAAWRRAAFKKQGHEIVRIRAPTRLLHATKPV